MPGREVQELPAVGLAVGLLLLLVAVSAAQCLLGVGRAHRQSRGSAVPPPAVIPSLISSISIRQKTCPKLQGAVSGRRFDPHRSHEPFSASLEVLLLWINSGFSLRNQLNAQM